MLLPIDRLLGRARDTLVARHWGDSNVSAFLSGHLWHHFWNCFFPRTSSRAVIVRILVGE